MFFFVEATIPTATLDNTLFELAVSLIRTMMISAHVFIVHSKRSEIIRFPENADLKFIERALLQACRVSRQILEFVHLQIKDSEQNVISWPAKLSGNTSKTAYQVHFIPKKSVNFSWTFDTDTNNIIDVKAFEPKLTRTAVEPHKPPTQIRHQLKNVNFDSLNVNNDQLCEYIEFMLYDLGIPKYLRIDAVTVRNFLKNVQHHYNPNPFHNFAHCFAVSQMVN